MKKLLLSSLAVAALSLASLSALAATFTQTSFPVSVTLTSACKTGAASGTGVDFGTYIAFGSAVGPITGPKFSIDCTRDLTGAPTTAFDTTNGTAAGDGVVAGLNYKLTVTPRVPAVGAGLGTAATAATTGQASGGNGTATNYEFAITGNMPANQAGSATDLTSRNRTLTITF